MTQTANVELKPWYESKINWTQVVGVAASVATIFGFTVPAEVIPHAVTGIMALQGFLTIVFKTWFTPTVTPASVGR